jgi:recombination protein RecT
MTTPTSAVQVHQETGIVRSVESSLWQREEAIRSILPNGMDMKRFVKTTMIALSKNPDLQRCTQESIVRSIIEAAEAGLEPTGMLSRAWLVPYVNKGVPEAQLQIGYQGLIDLARRSGEVRKIIARVVFEGDDFRVIQGSEERIEHTPAYLTEDPLKIEKVYAVASFKDGNTVHEVMTKAQVDGVRSKAKAKNAAAWTESYPEMARKTVVRRLAKYLPLTVEAVEAIAKDDEREYGTPTLASLAGPRPSSLKESIKQQAQEIEGEAVEVDASVNSAPVQSADQPTEPTFEADFAAKAAAAQAQPIVPAEGQASSTEDKCGEVSPYGDGVICPRKPGHPGSHMDRVNRASVTW